ncbi:hypothetical protein [Bacillus salipaludis]|uniref:hypothetical protein n=1 Tax=Bacillus salipaludis TaxID=2547811 RepID=UPI002E239A87|nr:hypothetical protein [Bacillus salipaludis]
MKRSQTRFHSARADEKPSKMGTDKAHGAGADEKKSRPGTIKMEILKFVFFYIYSQQNSSTKPSNYHQ